MGFKNQIVAVMERIPGLKQMLKFRRQRVFRKMALQDPRINANRVYKHIFHKDINWENPQNLIEKIYWLQLFTDTTLWTKCADKYRMREYVESKGCGHLLPKLYGHWENAEDIDYGKLPQSFVLKTTNGCGQVLIVPDKSELNIVETNKLLNQWMELKYGFTDAQIHYSRIEPCIIAEEYLSVNEKRQSLIDYKVWCFEGKPEYILVVHDRIIRGPGRNYKTSAYDLDWNNISDRALNKDNCHFDGIDLPRPKCLDGMIKHAAILSASFSEVRVDFYDIDGRLVLGEMTFTSGYGSHNEAFYEYLGSKIDLSKVRKLREINKPKL